jgi:methylthioribose-1-phosphate isomerase
MRTVEWHEDGDSAAVRMIDQKQIPWKLVQVDLHDYPSVAAAITDMTVRGAPAIGAAAAFGLALAARNSPARSVPRLIGDLQQAAQALKASRPTAINLAWAVDRVMAVATSGEFSDPDDLRAILLDEAQRIAGRGRGRKPANRPTWGALNPGRQYHPPPLQHWRAGYG